MMEETSAAAVSPLPPATHRHKWRWLSRGLSFVAAASALAAALFYLPFFRVQSITVTGNHYVPTEDICRIAGVYRGQHLLQVKTTAAAHTLMKDLRIDQASIHRVIPNGITIEVEERRPVAAIACEYGFLDLDRWGLVLNAHRQWTPGSVPLIAGASVRDRYIGDTIDESPLREVLRYLSHIKPEALGQITDVTLSSPEHIVAHTVNAAEIRVGSLEPERLEQKAGLTQDFLEELRTTKHPMEFIDLTYSQPFVKFRD